MKNIAIAFAFAIAGLAAGTLTSFYISNKLTFGIEQELFAHRMLRFNAETQVASALINIQRAQNGDVASIIRNNCQLARSAVRLIEPGIYSDPQKRAEVSAVASRAVETVLALEASGKCARPLENG